MTRITENNVSYIRNHMEAPDEDLADQFGLSEYVVSVIKEAKRNDYWKGYNKDQGGRGLFRKLTPNMKEYLLTIDYETQRALKRNFNIAFRQSGLTPLARSTIVRYKKRLEG